MSEDRRTCASCGATNEEDARFCESCGASLARICATCGVEASATARFCRGCGAPLEIRTAGGPDLPPAGPVRKTVTVMFADLAGSTGFEEKVDAETAREVIGRYHELLRSTAQRHRAGVTKYIGDGFMAVWGVPEIGPDDAAHAVDAAVELQDHFVHLAARIAEAHAVELDLRVAVNTGEVVVGAGDADLVGDALNVGARLEAECPRGRVVVGGETWRSTRGRYTYESLGQIQVKGRSGPVAVYQWLGRQSDAADAAPFVGRADEMRRLHAVLDDAVAVRAARLVTVIGDPGVGKSRLAAEFIDAHGDARLIQARCDLEATVALAPIVEVLRSRDLESDLPATVGERQRLLRALNGLAAGVPGSVEENFWALRRFVEVLARDGPVMFVIDDIQWADALLVDFIEHLVEWVQDVPVLVLALARNELREIRPDLVTVSRWVSEAVHLSGLDATATAELAAKVLGATRLPDELLRRLPESTGGNPLFVRELIGMLAHDGVLVQQAAGWHLTIDVDAIAIPPTIHALLASRLERLDATDRRVLEIASVVGSDFALDTVRALADSDTRAIRLTLNRLRRLELAEPTGTYVGDEPVWRFHHVLVRDVAYRRLLKSDRADLHERLADWVEAGGPTVAFDPDEMSARHLEAAHTYRVELGLLDEHTATLAVRSARHYAASARRALDRDELVSAGTQAARGAAMANADEAVRAELLLIGCEAFLSAGDVTGGAPLVDDLETIPDETLAPWATCYRCQFVIYTDPERLLEVDTRLQNAIDEFGRRADAAGLAKAHRVRAGARLRLGRVGDGEADLFEALIAARRSGDHRQITAALGAAPAAALWGPSPVPKAGGRCLDVVRMQRMTTAAPSLEATSMRHLAVLELLRGRPDKARTMLAEARQIVADLGLRHGLMETELFAGIIESMEGDPVAAEPHFRTALEGLDALGVGADAGQAAALLARSVLAQGRVDEADRYATESEQLAGRNLKTAIAWRAVRAEILSAQGRFGEAVAMAREAVAVAAGTDIVLDHAEACLALSRVLAAAGDTAGADRARTDAERLYAAKEVANRAEPSAKSVGTGSPPLGGGIHEPSKLPLTNRACEVLSAYFDALRNHDVDGVLACYADEVVHDDRRRLSGDPVHDRDTLRAGIARFLEDYTQFDHRVLAVRGQRLALVWTRFSDDNGNETTAISVGEVDDGGRLVYHGRFDDEDFDGAYGEFERRYYAGEGAAFAEAGAVSTEYFSAFDRGDFDKVFDELFVPGFRVENRSSSAFPDRSVSDLRRTYEDLHASVASARSWNSVVHWLSPELVVGRFERTAVGHDGEKYSWSWLQVNELRGRQLASICRFDPHDEASAFDYAEERLRAATSRMAVTNQFSGHVSAFFQALRAHDTERALSFFSDRLVYDDHRRLSGDPIVGRDAMRGALERIFEQYTHFDYRVLAVRGQRFSLIWNRWSDDHGNETTTFYVNEVGQDGLSIYQGRFDESDFEDAYRELERRYLAGENAMYAESGLAACEAVLTLNRNEMDRFFDEFCTPDFHVENHSATPFPDRSADDMRASFGTLNSMVTSSHSWGSSVYWLSPTVSITRLEREAVGPDDEEYAWTRLIVAEHRNGRFASMCEFDIEGEEAAFAYAEERVRASTSRLAVNNRAGATVEALLRMMLSGDLDGAIGLYSDAFVYDDHRRLSGDPVVGHDAMRIGMSRLVEQYPLLEWRMLAVRGERLTLHFCRQWDDDGNEAAGLQVFEVDHAGQIEYQGRFDDDDFEGAYRELDRRYHVGEGAAYAPGGSTLTDWVIAMNRGEIDRIYDDFVTPDVHVENRSSSAFGNRSVEEYRTSLKDLNTMIASQRTWYSVTCWLSPTLVVLRGEREAVGHDGEQYTWTKAYVIEIRDGRATSMCEFDLEDEASAFAYAEERLRASASRLAVRNRASDLLDASWRAMRDHDVDAAVGQQSDRFVYDDRRRLSGDPIDGAAELRTAAQRILQHYPHREWRTLAVRGERLELRRTRLSDDAGNETTTLDVLEVDDNGLDYFGRFDEDDFEGAYSELERRYYAGEGAQHAEAGAIATEAMLAMNRGDLDRMFGGASVPDMSVENRSTSLFPSRSAADVRADFEELNAMVASTRTWLSVLRWVSPTVTVARFEREAIGQDGERYSWTRIYVNEIRDGRMASMCQFDIEDEEAAFADAERRARESVSRLAVTNDAAKIAAAGWQAMSNHDAEGLLALYAEQFEYDDQRRLGGDPIVGREAMRIAVERVLEQYARFDFRPLAVRGERLLLGESRWSDRDGNSSAHLHVFETDVDGKFSYDGRFDEQDFEGAYRELERRYYCGDGAAFAEAGARTTDYLMAYNDGDFDRIDELTAPDFRLTNQSRTPFGDRSAAEFRSSSEELTAMVSSVRTWTSAIRWLSPSRCVVRNERDAVGRDGERYAWSRIYVGEVRDGLVASLCQFDIKDEEAAFTYAEQLAASRTSRLAVVNTASRTWQAIEQAAQARDLDAIAAWYPPSVVDHDHRRLSGFPVDDWRAAAEQVGRQYTQFEMRTLAVRGDRLHLSAVRYWNDSGFESGSLWVLEVDEVGQVIEQWRFDDEDFESAYRQLDQRYYAGEGMAFADAGAVATEYPILLSRGDFDRLYGDLTCPGFRIDDRSRSLFGERSPAEVRATYDELFTRVASLRVWHSAMDWLSPTLVVARFEQDAVGTDGEQFAWCHIDVVEITNGRITSLCLFELDDEEAAFAYAEERMRAASSRLSVTNLARETWDAMVAASQGHDVDAMISCYAQPFDFDDKRRLGGYPLTDLRAAAEQILAQYKHFAARTLAVRGERLHLGWGRWSNDDGYETAYLFVHEIGEDGRIIYEGRFDEDDFEGAHRELQRRYFAGEGAEFAEMGLVVDELTIAMDRGEFDRILADLTHPAFRLENRSRSIFPDRSASEMTAGFEDMANMVVSTRTWNSALYWLRPSVLVGNFEREATGADGERYAWSGINVAVLRDGKIASVCLFEPSDEDAAFAYADEQVRCAENG